MNTVSFRVMGKNYPSKEMAKGTPRRQKAWADRVWTAHHDVSPECLYLKFTRIAVEYGWQELRQKRKARGKFRRSLGFLLEDMDSGERMINQAWGKIAWEVKQTEGCCHLSKWEKMKVGIEGRKQEFKSDLFDSWTHVLSTMLLGLLLL